MIDRSDLVVCCVERKAGESYECMKYANKTGKKIVNVSSMIVIT